MKYYAATRSHALRIFLSVFLWILIAHCISMLHPSTFYSTSADGKENVAAPACVITLRCAMAYNFVIGGRFSQSQSFGGFCVISVGTVGGFGTCRDNLRLSNHFRQLVMSNDNRNLMIACQNRFLPLNDERFPKKIVSAINLKCLLNKHPTRDYPSN